MHDLPLYSCKHSKFFDSKVATVSDRSAHGLHTRDNGRVLKWNVTKKFCMINLDHVHFQHKTVIYFIQTFGNIYTIVPFCKHALCVFHAIAWLILLAHAQTNFPPVPKHVNERIFSYVNLQT
jgi:hypothetical protein